MKFLDEFVDYHKDFTSCPETFVRWSGIYALSCVANWNHVYRTGNWNCRPHLWILLCGEPSTKKSTALFSARSLISKIETRIPNVSLVAEQHYSHASFIVEMAENPHRCFFYDEAETFFKMIDEKYNGSFRSDLMQLHGDKVIGKKVRGVEGKGEIFRTEKVPGINGYIGPYLGPYVCWGAATTPAQINRHLRGLTDEVDSGFFPRMLLIPQIETTKVIPRPPPHDPLKFEALLKKLQALFDSPNCDYAYSKSAGAIYDAWHLRMSAKLPIVDPMLQPFYMKMIEIHCHQIALLSAFERQSSTIEDDDVSFAMTMLLKVEKGWPSLIGKFTESKSQKEEARILNYVKTNSPCTPTQIIRALRMDGDVIQKKLAIAEKNGILSITAKPSTTKPGKIVTWLLQD